MRPKKCLKTYCGIIQGTCSTNVSIVLQSCTTFFLQSQHENLFLAQFDNYTPTFGKTYTNKIVKDVNKIMVYMYKINKNNSREQVSWAGMILYTLTVERMLHSQSILTCCSGNLSYGWLSTLIV